MTLNNALKQAKVMQLHEVIAAGDFRQYDEANDTGGDGIIHKSVQYAVWCCRCDNLEDYAPFRNRRKAEAKYRSLGWKKAKAGWQCPRHSGGST